jgi:hypothetical protein
MVGLRKCGQLNLAPLEAKTCPAFRELVNSKTGDFVELVTAPSQFTILQFNTVALFLALSCGDICPGTLRSVQFFVFDQFFN